MSRSASATHSDFCPQDLAAECRNELLRIGQWWLTHAQDSGRGGFYGEVDQHNRPVAEADKGIVLNTRILWFFSEAASFTGREDFRRAAERAYDYLKTYFYDAEHGGYFWLLSAGGEIKEDKKQVYAQAFALYALTAYYQLTADDSALQAALQCFDLIERHCVDRERGGYYEAYTRAWGKIEDVRLSEKDLNFPKTMNTHLHVLEAYTQLYKVHASEPVERALGYCIDLFDRHLIDRENFHLRMFLADDWADHSPALTFGHDIECAWLLHKAVKALGDDVRRLKLQPDILALAKTCEREALGSLGEVYDSADKASGQIHKQRVWWVQAEALVGFLDAWKLSGDPSLLASATGVWTFIKTYQIDREGAEWLWHSQLDEPDGSRDYKAGCWKGPYHNGRAMMEVVKLLSDNN